MPNLQLEGLDKSYFNTTTKQQYLSNFRASQQVYYWILLSLGSVFFLVGAII